MFKHFVGTICTKQGFLFEVEKAKLASYVLVSRFHNGQVGLDDDNSRPYTYKKEKKSKNPQKHISFKQRTIAFMEPFTLDVFISKRYKTLS